MTSISTFKSTEADPPSKSTAQIHVQLLEYGLHLIPASTYQYEK